MMFMLRNRRLPLLSTAMGETRICYVVTLTIHGRSIDVMSSTPCLESGPTMATYTSLPPALVNSDVLRYIC